MLLSGRNFQGFLVAFFLSINYVRAVVNLNLKSSLLSHLLRGEHGVASTPATPKASDDARPTAAPASPLASQQPPALKHKSDIIQLDLSGTMQAHVAGPMQRRQARAGISSPDQDGEDDDEKMIMPLVPTQGPLSLICGVDYDFSKRWFGARKLLATLRWDRAWFGGPAARKSPLDGTSAPSLIPKQIDVVAEQSLEDPYTAGQLVFGWVINNEKPLSTLKLRATGSGQNSLSLALPVHNRVHLELNLVRGRPLISQHNKVDRTNEDWWIPDVAVNALGHLKSQNEVWIRSPTRLRRWFDGSLGVRLEVRRRLGWSVLGLATDQEPETWIGVDLRGLDNRYSSAARVEVQLERLQESARMSFRQDIAVGPSLTSTN